MIEMRQAVSSDEETIAHFNIALSARESYRRLGFSETGYVVFERLLSSMDET